MLLHPWNLSSLWFLFERQMSSDEMRLASPKGTNGSESLSYDKKVGLSAQFRTPHVITLDIWMELFILIEVNLNSCTSNCLPCAAPVSHNNSAQAVKCFLLEQIQAPFSLLNLSTVLSWKKVHRPEASCWLSRGNERTVHLWRHQFECGLWLLTLLCAV